MRAVTIGQSVHDDQSLARKRRVGDVMTRLDAISESIVIIQHRHLPQPCVDSMHSKL